MRLWSIHPKYLDTKGLVALWREALLAKHVLEGKTKGYLHHPQLFRFRSCRDPQAAIHLFLRAVYEEASHRNYNFDRTKFAAVRKKISITVNHEQVNYESRHLLLKLKTRDRELYNTLSKKKVLQPHPLFTVVQGPVEKWEII